MSESEFEKTENEFGSLESALANTKLPELRLDRDHLMYRSGYEAAMKVASGRGAVETVTDINAKCDQIGDHDSIARSRPLNFPKRNSAKYESDEVSSITRWKAATILFASLAALFAVMAFSQTSLDNDVDQVGLLENATKQRGTDFAADHRGGNVNIAKTEGGPELNENEPGSAALDGVEAWDWTDPVRLVERPVSQFSSALLRNRDGIFVNRVDFRSRLDFEDTLPTSPESLSSRELMRRLQQSH